MTSEAGLANEPIITTKMLSVEMGWHQKRVMRHLLKTEAGYYQGRNVVTDLGRLEKKWPAAFRKFSMAAEERRTRRLNEMATPARVALLASKMESDEAQLRALRQELRQTTAELRSEIRKLKRRLRKHTGQGQAKCPESGQSGTPPTLTL